MLITESISVPPNIPPIKLTINTIRELPMMNFPKMPNNIPPPITKVARVAPFIEFEYFFLFRKTNE